MVGLETVWVEGNVTLFTPVMECIVYVYVYVCIHTRGGYVY